MIPEDKLETKHSHGNFEDKIAKGEVVVFYSKDYIKHQLDHDYNKARYLVLQFRNCSANIKE